MSELIGRGTYGCVVNPPITDNIIKKYKEYENILHDDVGKLFKPVNSHSFQTEYRNYTHNYKLIPNYNKITVPVKGVNVISQVNNYEIGECLDLHKKEKNYIFQIIYKNAGKSFMDLPINFINFEKFIKIFLKFMINFKIYNDGKYIHGDINSGNIMININTSEILLIDFYFQETHETFLNEDNKKTLLHKYAFYPPEYKLLYMNIYNDKESYDKQLSNFVSVQKKINSFTSSNLYSNAAIKKNITKLFNTFNIKDIDFAKIDIYSIGINLHLMRDSIIFNHDKDVKLFNKLIKNMVCFDPVKRYDINQVIRFLKKYN